MVIVNVVVGVFISVVKEVFLIFYANEAIFATLSIVLSNFCFAAGNLLCFERLFSLTGEIPSNSIVVSNLIFFSLFDSHSSYEFKSSLVSTAFL